ncbi:hypothetical protein SAMN05216223_103124 [Actinacidiphila yanglinensis]|uniref:AAA domain-containing protein n=1 Tax=Actinacidiphila yanglinensis TaxID=310779 RepID=A0A1H5X6T9_9ACTN|nr:hypothetical protein SAMN05216223_103124 [Actinacidiphila yanglinensis]
MISSQQRPIVTELRLSAFKSHRGATFPLEPLTLLAGGSGTGKSSVLEGLAVLGRLASGADLEEVFAVSRNGRSFVRGGAAACVPQGALPDAQGRRGFRIGCTTAGPLGPVRLDLAVQVEPTLRIVGERLTGSGETLLTTALRDPTRPTVQAAWHTAGAVAVTRAPLPDDRLATALLPLRVSGRTDGQRLVLAAAEQLVVALRGVFPIAPRPELMRGPVRVGDGRLRSSCDNLSAVLARTEDECSIRHGMLVGAVRAVCSGPVHGLTTLPALIAGDSREPLVEAVIAAVDRGSLGMVPVDRLGDGELRFLALALVLLTGPGVLDVDTSTEHLPAGQVLTVVADGFDVGVDRRQVRELLRLAEVASARGHIRLLCTVQDPVYGEEREEVALTVLGEGSVIKSGGGKRRKRGSGGEGSAEGESVAGGEPEGAGDPSGAEGAPGAAEAVGGVAPVGVGGTGSAGEEQSACGGGELAAAVDGEGTRGCETGESREPGAPCEAEGAAAVAEGPSPGGPEEALVPVKPLPVEPGAADPEPSVRVPDGAASAGFGRKVDDWAESAAEPLPGSSPSYGRPQFGDAYGDFESPDFESPGSEYDDFGYDGSEYVGSGYDDASHGRFDVLTDHVYADTVDAMHGHAEPAWIDSAFTEPALPGAGREPDPSPATPVRAVPAARAESDFVRPDRAPCTCARGEQGRAASEGEDEVDRSV